MWSAARRGQVRRRIGMSSEARVGVLSEAQSRDQPISQYFSQSPLDRSDLPCQVMAEKAPEGEAPLVRVANLTGCMWGEAMPEELGSDAVRDACLVCAMTVRLANTLRSSACRVASS